MGVSLSITDLKCDFEQNEKKLVGVIWLFSAGIRVALNLKILVTPSGFEPELTG